MTESIKRIVRVTIEKEIEIEIMPSMFGSMTEAEYLASFRSGLWHVESMDDVIKYAARMVAYHGGGYQHDGLGLLGNANNTYQTEPDVKFREVDDQCDEEIIEGGAA